MENLSIRENDEFEVVDEGVEEGAATQPLCLVGRFHTDRSVRVAMMKDRMAEIWRPGRGVTITEIQPGVFAFQFYHELDVQKVLKQGPWYFDRNLLVLGVVHEGTPPQDVPLHQVPFWVQVHDLPFGFMSESVGKGLGNSIGEFLEYDEKNSSNVLRSFMRIRVMVDVTLPLMRSKKIRKQGGEARMVVFKYERLEVFCYICGRLGHGESSCEQRFLMGVDDGVRGWGPELRAELRRGGTVTKSRWLRDAGDGGWVNPNQSCYVGRNNGSEGRSCYGSSTQGANQGDIVGQVGPTNTNAMITTTSSTKPMPSSCISMAEIFKAPQLFFPTKKGDPCSVKGVVEGSNNKDLDDIMVIDSDRKRQRGNELEPGTGSAVSAGGEVTMIDGNNPFLTAGPGNQACQDK